MNIAKIIYMKKIFPLFMISLFILSIFSFITIDKSCFALEIGIDAKVIASECCVYKNADFTSDKIKISIEGQEVAYKLTHGEIVEVLIEEGDFIKIKSSQEIEGYVYKYYLTQNSSQTRYPVFNASIRNDTTIYDINLNDSGFKVLKGERVFIYKAYSEKKDYTAVQVVLEDQSLYNGYILTKDVKPDGISGILIAGISVIAAAVTIILAIVFIRKKKKKD